MKKRKSLNFEQVKKKALEHLRSGKWMCNSDGAFAPLFRRFSDAAELESDIDDTERKLGRP